jgi:hypothetical protein
MIQEIYEMLLEYSMKQQLRVLIQRIYDTFLNVSVGFRAFLYSMKKKFND